MGAIIRPIKNEFASFTKDVWFLLGKEGGWWSLSEILARLDADYSRREYNPRAIIANMAQRHLLCKRHTPETGATYGVTRTCMIPRNLTLAEIEQLVGIRFIEPPKGAGDAKPIPRIETRPSAANNVSSHPNLWPKEIRHEEKAAHASRKKAW